MFEIFNIFRKEKFFIDFILKVNDKDFLVYKNVLVVSCDYFNEFFFKYDDFNFVLYELVKLELSVVENVINFLYIGKCKLDWYNVILMLYVIKVLGIEDLFDFLEKNMVLVFVKMMNDEIFKWKMFNLYN